MACDQRFRISAAIISRRSCLRMLAACGLAPYAWRTAAASTIRHDVPWLGEVDAPPASVPNSDVGRLAPLLRFDDGTPVRTLADWRRRRSELKRQWLEFLGPMPDDRPAVRMRVLREEEGPTWIRQRIRYVNEPGEEVEAYLLRPRRSTSNEADARRPALVALHSTTRLTIEEIAGVTGRANRQLGPLLAAEGFVVICPQNFLWRDVGDYREAVDRFRRRHPQTRGMHKMLFDAQRAVDVLAALPDVDAKRIGAVGHSLGGKEVLYLAAFDERIRGGVASEAGLGFRFTNWDAPWYLGPDIHQPAFALNHHQLLALAAPRPLLILAGEAGRGASDGDRSWPLLTAARPVWELYGEPVRLGLFNHRQGHDIPPAAMKRLVEWLRCYVAGVRV